MSAGFTRIALIGFGEVGQTLGADLLAAGASVSAYDPLFGNSNSVPSRALTKLRVVAQKTAPEAVRDAELVISAVTAGCYVEAAVMTPIAPKRIASSMLLGGPHAGEFITRAQPLGFSGAKVFSQIIGQASATKMCRSVIIKGTEALLLESMIAARHYGVEKTVLDSLSDLMPVGDWDRLARYMISRALEHGARRAEEMRESAKTVAEAGLAPLMTKATAEREDWAAARKEALAHMNDLGALLDAIRRTMAREAQAAPKAAE